MKKNILIKYFFVILFFLFNKVSAFQTIHCSENYKVTFFCAENIFLEDSFFNKDITDDSCFQNKKNKFFLFNDKLDKFHKIDIDSLLKKFKTEIDLNELWDKDSFKKFDNNFPKYWKEFPRFDDEPLNKMLEELNKNFNKDSLLKKFKYFKRNNLFDSSELTEI